MKRNFFYHLKSKTRDWSLIEMKNIEVIANVPSLRWKRMNLKKSHLKTQKALKKLKSTLYPNC